MEKNSRLLRGAALWSGQICKPVLRPSATRAVQAVHASLMYGFYTRVFLTQKYQMCLPTLDTHSIDHQNKSSSQESALAAAVARHSAVDPVELLRSC